MATYTTDKVKFIYNGVEIQAITPTQPEIAIDMAALMEYVSKSRDEAASEVISIPLELSFNWGNWTIRPRVASRQSCLWRHSFNWRNRKRGHPIHRNT